MPISIPAKGRKPARVGEAKVEIYDRFSRLWDEDHCGECFYLEPEPASRSYTPRSMADMPHLDRLHRYLADQYVANRSNMVGAHLKPVLAVMESVIAVRDGSSVYFAEAGDRVKIGWSKRVSARLAELQTGSAVPIRLIGAIPGGRALERRLHEEFAHLRLSGEWFSATPELLAHIGGLTANDLVSAA